MKRESLSLESLRTGGEAFIEEISREYYLAHSGQKATAELQPIYAKHAEIMSKDALALAIDAFKSAPESCTSIALNPALRKPSR